MKELAQYFNRSDIKLLVSLGTIIVTVTLWGAKLDAKLDLVKAGQDVTNEQFKENGKTVTTKLDSLEEKQNETSKEVAVLRQALKDRNLITATQLLSDPKTQYAYAISSTPSPTPTPTPTSQEQAFKNERNLAKKILLNLFSKK